MRHTSTARGTASRPGPAYDVARVRGEFPGLAQTVHGKPLVYLDNAATTQKPRRVLEALERFYVNECSNVHRGLHELSSRATADFEGARDLVQRFIGAADRREIVFTRGTTESINLVARSWGEENVGAGDEILLTTMEHHSNIVPWQLLCERRGARIVVAPVTDRGELDLDALAERLGPRTRLVGLVHTSNALGTRNPVERVCEMAHTTGALVLVDGAQAMAHEAVDVQALGCDFFAFSGHKMYGPTGIGALWARAELLEAMPPFHGGGEMIRSVTFEKTTYNELPHKFEAGTPDIAGAIGLGAATEVVAELRAQGLAEWEAELGRRAVERLGAKPRVRLVGAAARRAAVVSFVIDGVHPHDAGTVLDHEGIAVRAGHHCTQPLMARFGVPATVRASFACYNTLEELDALEAGIDRAIEVLG